MNNQEAFDAMMYRIVIDLHRPTLQELLLAQIAYDDAHDLLIEVRRTPH